MNTQINRKAFLHVSLATTLAGIVGCSGDETMNGDGDGDMGTGGNGQGTGGAGTGGVGTGGGTATGGSGSGGDSATGGAGSGGDSATGGAGTGGDSATGGAGTGGDGGGLMCTADITVTSSSSGHTHTLTVTAAMLNAGAAVTGLETGAAPSAGNHTHTVDLTAEDIATIKAGGVVKKFTCDGGDHEYVISCDPSAPAPLAPNGEGVLVGFCDQ